MVQLTVEQLFMYYAMCVCVIYTVLIFTEIALKVHCTQYEGQEKMSLHILIFQVSVKIQFDRLQTTYLLTEQRKKYGTNQNTECS